MKKPQKPAKTLCVLGAVLLAATVAGDAWYYRPTLRQLGKEISSIRIRYDEGGNLLRSFDDVTVTQDEYLSEAMALERTFHLENWNDPFVRSVGWIAEVTYTFADGTAAVYRYEGNTGLFGGEDRLRDRVRDFHFRVEQIGSCRPQEPEEIIRESVQ